MRTRPGIWQRIVEALTEASNPLEKLINYITQRYGEHEADELRKRITSRPPGEVRRYLALQYMDPKVDKLASGFIQSVSAERPRRSHEPPREPGSSTDKGFSDEPIPDRPDRAGTRANVPSSPPLTLRPGERPTQAVGTAGQHAPKGREGIPDYDPKQVKRVEPGLSMTRGILGLEPDQAFAQADREAGKVHVPKIPEIDPTGANTRGGTQKPTFKGSFHGQVWSPNAFSKETADEIKAAQKALRADPHDRAAQLKLAMAMRRAGGFSKAQFKYGNAATGRMQRGSAERNPERTRGIPVKVAVVDPTTGKPVMDPHTGKPRMKVANWYDEKSLIWDDETQDWLTPSAFAAAEALRKTRRDAGDEETED